MDIKEMLLTPNQCSRPQITLTKVTHLVIHWVANPGSTAVDNRNYFESLKTKKTFASAHYIIGLEGEVIRCIPETEIAYHAKSANNYSIGIENCHPDWLGKFNQATYNSLIQLCVMLCEKYKLKPQEALLRHYDVTKKRCPKYYVENEKEWQKLKDDVQLQLEKNQQAPELWQAVEGIIAYGIQLDIKVWGKLETMNMKYAKIMVERIGMKFGKKSYAATIDFLVNKGCISSRELWDAEKFTSSGCCELLTKIYIKIIKNHHFKDLNITYY